MPNNYKILAVTPADFEDWNALALKLWPEHSLEGLKKELSGVYDSPRQEAFLVRNEAGKAIAFINLSLRNDYVPGAKTSPVAYIEGIYVRKDYRKRGLAASLVTFAGQWGLSKKCSELASDALIDNAASHQFHQRTGFREVERVVSFIQTIPPEG